MLDCELYLLKWMETPGIVIHMPLEAEAEGSLQAQSQPGLHNKFKASLRYIQKSVFKNINKIMKWRELSWALGCSVKWCYICFYSVHSIFSILWGQQYWRCQLYPPLLGLRFESRALCMLVSCHLGSRDQNSHQTMNLSVSWLNFPASRLREQISIWAFRYNSKIILRHVTTKHLWSGL